MNNAVIRRAALAALATCASLLAQDATPQDHTDREARYIVTLPDGGLDRPALRAAILGRDFDAARTLVDEHRARLATLDDPTVAAVETAGFEILERYWLVDALLVRGAPADRSALAAIPGVLTVQDDATREPCGLSLPIRNQTNGNNHHTDEVHAAGIRGAGVTVAIIDTGFDAASGNTGRPHQIFYPDGNLAANGGGIGGSRLLANVALGTAPADNGFDHGTKVAGVTIGGTWSAPTGDDGQAPQAKVVGYAVADVGTPNTRVSTLVRAWQQVALDRRLPRLRRPARSRQRPKQ